MTQRRREEMLTYRRQAMKLENRRKSKQREQLVAKVQSIVAEVEVCIYTVITVYVLAHLYKRHKTYKCMSFFTLFHHPQQVL